ncbi:MAG: hypothetical protein WC494_02155 [Candidatus Pacearchaeota archaeon]
MRVKFHKGQQRKFLDKVINETNSPSLRGLIQFGFNLPYSTLKNYYNESRLLPKTLFEDFCNIARISPEYFIVEYLKENWGKIKGGKKSKGKSIR